jgi:hypothetical protein
MVNSTFLDQRGPLTIAFTRCQTHLPCFRTMSHARDSLATRFAPPSAGALAALSAQVLSLEIPMPHELPGLLRDESAQLLDGLLVRVARGFGALQLAIGEGLASLAVGDRALRLGYSGIGDFGRERLGMKPRTAQELAHLARGLRERPLLAEAVRSGEIGTTKARVILHDARGDDERRWVAVARAETVRALEALVARERRAAAAAPDPSDEPWDRLVCGMGPKAQARLDLALQRADDELGPGTSRWEQVEALGQEFLSSHPCDELPSVEDGVDFQPSGGWLEAAKAGLEAETQRWAYLADVPPTPVPVDGLDEETAPQALAARLEELAAMRDAWDALVGHLALILKLTGLWRDMGFATFGHYCAERLWLAGRTVEQRAWLEHRLVDEPALRAAYRARKLTYEQARLLAGTLPSGTLETWIDEAQRLTAVALRDRLAASRERQMRAQHTVEVRMPRRVAKLLLQAFHTVRKVRGTRLTDSQCLLELAEHFLRVWGEARKPRKTASRRVRDRDAHRCSVPGCSRVAGHAHHVRFRSHLGPTTPGNLTSVCPAHHWAIHQGYLRVWGEAPDRLRWELGERPRPRHRAAPPR